MPRSSTPRLAAALTALLAVWLFGYRLSYTPPHWEEPRRAIVAFEMIHNGDYVVPTVLGEPYTKKPPLQNWLVAALARWDTARIDAIWSRWISVLAMFATAGFVVALASPPGRRARWRWLPALVFLTYGISVQYGRSGEIDPLFTFWTTGALFFFELGRRRGNPWVKWVPSHLMVAGGLLTKGLSPLFFWPPVIVWELVERRRAREPASGRAWLQVSIGLAAMALVVAAWVVPYALSGSLDLLLATGKEQILDRTPGDKSALRFFAHLAAFPFEILGNLMPWSLLVFALVSPNVRRVGAELWRQEPAFRLLSIAAAWGMLVLWPMPGSLGRYAMPAYPHVAAVLYLWIERVRGTDPLESRRGGRSAIAWLSLAALWVVAVVVVCSQRADVHPTWPIGAGLLALGLIAWSDRRPWGLPRPVPWLLALGFLYGAYHASINESRHALRDRERNAEIRALADELVEDAAEHGLDPARVPVVCARSFGLAECLEIMKVLGRPLQRKQLDPGERGYRFVKTSDALPVSGRLVGERRSRRLWGP